MNKINPKKIFIYVIYGFVLINLFVFAGMAVMATVGFSQPADAGKNMSIAYSLSAVFIGLAAFGILRFIRSVKK